MCPYDVTKDQFLLDDDLHGDFRAEAIGRAAVCDRRLLPLRVRLCATRRSRPTPDSAAGQGALPSAVRVRARRSTARARDRSGGWKAGADQAPVSGAAVLRLPGHRVQLRHLVQQTAERRVYTHRDRRAEGFGNRRRRRRCYEAIRAQAAVAAAAADAAAVRQPGRQGRAAF